MDEDKLAWWAGRLQRPPTEAARLFGDRSRLDIHGTRPIGTDVDEGCKARWMTSQMTIEALNLDCN